MRCSPRAIATASAIRSRKSCNATRNSGAALLRSDQDGAILVEMDAQGLRVERYRDTHRRYWMHSPRPYPDSAPDLKVN